jgi:hypothetical protein
MPGIRRTETMLSLAEMGSKHFSVELLGAEEEDVVRAGDGSASEA